jgi:enoyl-CoA hydratase/carnithine racemase
VAVGGGVGLVAIADVAVAADGASFQLAEVRLGLVPAMVMPYVARRIGPGRAREWALTGERIDAAQALAWGLVGTVVPADRLDDAVAGKIELLRAGAPGALAALKSFLHRASVLPPAQAAEEAVDLIAERIASEEARELIRAFAERKRGPRPA